MDLTEKGHDCGLECQGLRLPIIRGFDEFDTFCYDFLTRTVRAQYA